MKKEYFKMQTTHAVKSPFGEEKNCWLQIFECCRTLFFLYNIGSTKYKNWLLFHSNGAEGETKLIGMQIGAFFLGGGRIIQRTNSLDINEPLFQNFMISQFYTLFWFYYFAERWDATKNDVLKEKKIDKKWFYFLQELEEWTKCGWYFVCTTRQQERGNISLFHFTKWGRVRSMS